MPETTRATSKVDAVTFLESRHQKEGEEAAEYTAGQSHEDGLAEVKAQNGLAREAKGLEDGNFAGAFAD